MQRVLLEAAQAAGAAWQSGVAESRARSTDVANPNPSSTAVIDAMAERQASLDRAESLRFVIAQNWEHARHVENLRERLNNLYWISWGAVLAFVGTVGSAGGSATPTPVYTYLSFFLFVVSVIVLMSTLKWTAEFANHVAAVARASEELRLNRVATANEASALPWISRNQYLPYPEFKGVMALPLRWPLYLSVGGLMPIAQSFALSFALAFFVTAAPSPSAPVLGSVSSFISGTVLGWAGSNAGLVAFAVALTASAIVLVTTYKLMKVSIPQRLGTT